MFFWAKYRILTRLLQSWQTLGTASRWSAKPSLTAPNFFHRVFFSGIVGDFLQQIYVVHRIPFTKKPSRIPIRDPVLMFFDSRFGYLLKWWVLPMGSFGLFIGGSRSHFRKHGQQNTALPWHFGSKKSSYKNVTSRRAKLAPCLHLDPAWPSETIDSQRAISSMAN